MWVTNQDGTLVNLERYARIEKAPLSIEAYDADQGEATLFYSTDNELIEKVMQHIRTSIQHHTLHIDLRKITTCIKEAENSQQKIAAIYSHFNTHK